MPMITLTGADERTDLDALHDLALTFPEVEVGLLYSATPEGRPRYPGLPWIRRAARRLHGRVALHVCGSFARRELLDGDLADVVRHAPRVQVNGALHSSDVELLARRVGTLITQHNEANAHLLEVRAPNHCLLIDASAGRGLSPAQWTAPQTDKPYGFAGGMGPDNLAVELARTTPLAKPGSWWDMEGKLRVDDWFSVDLARRCAGVFADAVRARPTAPRRPRP